ncbi:MAG: hypothetical protein PUG06_03365 [Blautia sp.]|uniref:hypothetical protein n=1 Tax=Blautia sp. TaxID=1955243 RepID=UPI00262AED61|nr:hypothetical protein [Blautia sp.]MDD6413106.1 hypothetical protein [Blautia sp.]MDY4117238.1 hypothetical protein [Blautia sp.]
MEENKNEELQEQVQTESQEEQKPSSNARFMLWTLAGIYLLYTGYSLCKGFITGAEDTGIGFMLAGIAFAVIGVGLLVASIKTMISEDKLKKAKAAKDAAMLAAAGSELDKGDGSGTKKSMSISERANLAKRLENEEESEEE